MDDFIDKEEYHYPYDLVLNVTDACNLKCKYCFVEQHPNFMTLDVAKKALEFGANNRRKHIEEFKDLSPERKSQIVFFGGEPLLMFNRIIKPLVEFANQEYPNTFIYSITTNGTLLTHEIIDFLTNNNFSIMLSFDGFKEIQDSNRPCQDVTKSSFDMVFKNLDYLLYKNPNVVCRPTISKENIDQLFNIYRFFEICGFKNIELCPDLYSLLWDDNSIQILQREIRLIFLHRINQQLNGMPILNWNSINTEYKKIIMKNLNNYSNNNEKTFFRCGLGTSSCSIEYSGDIYGCQEQPSKKQQIFKIGDIFNNIDKEKHLLLLKKYKKELLNEEKCNLCLANNYSLYKNFSSCNKIYLAWKQIITSEVFNSLSFLLSKNNNNFYLYLKSLF